VTDNADPRSPPPKFTKPQLSLLVATPPSGPGWAHELKYDGYRIHARLLRGEARLLTRTGLDWTDRYEATAKAISSLAARSASLDGELCAVRPDGTTTFSEMQAAADEGARSTLCTSSLISCFSIARSWVACPSRTKGAFERSSQTCAAVHSIQRPPYRRWRTVPPGRVWGQGRGNHLEEGGRTHVPGERGLWRKTKCHQREEFVIVGYSEPEGSRSHLGACCSPTTD
jgi:hypothetical protein